MSDMPNETYLYERQKYDHERHGVWHESKPDLNVPRTKYIRADIVETLNGTLESMKQTNAALLKRLNAAISYLETCTSDRIAANDETMFEVYKILKGGKL
jgi:hypothetical protein